MVKILSRMYGPDNLDQRFVEAAKGRLRPAICVTKADIVGVDGASVGACVGIDVAVKIGAARGVLVTTGRGVEEAPGRGRGVLVAAAVGVDVDVGVPVIAKVEVAVALGEGLGVTTSHPSLRFRNTMYPSAAARTRTNAMSRSFLIR